VQGIITPVGYLLVHPGYLDTSHLTVLTADCFSRQRPLQAGELLFKATQMIGIADALGVRCDGPVLVFTVMFMEYTPGGGLRQPTFKGLRMIRRRVNVLSGDLGLEGSPQC